MRSTIAVVVVVLAVSASGPTAEARRASHVPSGKAVSALAIDRRAVGAVYAGTGLGVFKTVDGGATWRPAGALEGVADLAIDPTDSAVVYAATVHGVFRSSDGGTHWRARGLAIGTTALAVDPSSPRVLYAATDRGVFKTVDAGTVWRRVTEPSMTRVFAVAVDPRRPATVWAGAGAGVFKTTDGGRSWRSRNRGLFDGETASEREHRLLEGSVGAFAIDPADSNTVYVGYERGLSKTTDGGKTWRPSVRGWFVGGLALDPRDPRTVYAGILRRGVLKTTDGGRTWRSANRGIIRPYVAEAPFVAALAVDPTASATVYAGTERVVLRSDDGGARWRPASPFVLLPPKPIAKECDASGCRRVLKIDGAVYFELASATHEIGRYWLCVRRVPPASDDFWSRRFCVLYSTARRRGGWGSLVRYSEQFPQLGAGTYLVSWRMVGPSVAVSERIGRSLLFTLRST